AEARDSSLVEANFKKLLEPPPDAAAKLAQFGIDPMRDIDTLMFAGGGITELAEMKDVSQMVFIVEGRLPRKMVDAAALSRSKHRGVEILSREDTDAAFIGQRLFFTKKGGMPEAIDVALGKSKVKSVAQSAKAKPLRTVIAGTNIKSDVWMVVMIPDKDKTTMTQSGLTVDSMSASIKLAANLDAVVRLNAASDAEAAKGVSLFQTILPTLKSSMGGIGLQQSASSLTLTQDKAAIQVAGRLSAGELTSLIAMASGAPPPPPPKQQMPMTPKTGGLGAAKPTAPTPPPAAKP
ncbi:MAG: hypothetical protein H0T42_19780, partial [Deltaproteobacteria bacterium]|nr:hypothetical protein [Deltaproteobacteria bacterium]